MPAAAMPSFSRHRSRLANNSQPENNTPATNGPAIMNRNRVVFWMDGVTVTIKAIT